MALFTGYGKKQTQDYLDTVKNQSSKQWQYGTKGGTQQYDPYYWMKGDPGEKNWAFGAGMGTEYWKLKGQLLHDPKLNHLGDRAMELQGLGESLALSQADQTANSISAALAARGGGNIASALTMGSQARVGAGLQGMQAGVGMELGALGTYLQAKWGALTALFAKQAGFSAAQMQADTQKEISQNEMVAKALGHTGGAAGTALF